MFRQPPVILNTVPKVAYDMYNVHTVHLRNQPMREKASRNENFDAALGTVFRISSFFIEASIKFALIFLFKGSRK